MHLANKMYDTSIVFFSIFDDRKSNRKLNIRFDQARPALLLLSVGMGRL